MHRSPRPTRRLLRVCVAAALPAAASPAAAQEPATRDAAHADAIDSLVRAELRRTSAPGAQIAVVWHGRTIIDRGYGHADMRARSPVTAVTRFPIGSITKSFTAAAVLQQAAAGRMGLDSAVASYFPGRAVDRRVTLRHLLSHTSGLKPYEMLIPSVATFARTAVAPDTILAYVSGAALDFEPGARWAYSNTGYHLLGLALERATGRRFFDLLSARLARPLGLGSTGACDAAFGAAEVATGYELERAGLEETTLPHVNFSFSAGGLCATAADLVRWLRLLPSAVGAEHYHAMTAPTALPSGGHQPYGYGLATAELDGHAWIGHGGSLPGFDAFAAHYPNDSLTIAILANARPFDAEALHKRIARRLLAIPDAVARDLPLTPEQRGRYVGVYTVSGRSLRVVERDGRLRLLGPGDFTLLYQGDGTFVTREDADIRVRFVSEGGAVAGMIFTAPGRRFELAKQR